MAPRPTWRGYLRLSLVSCPVRLYTATTAADRISFHFLTPRGHRRIAMKPVDPATGQQLERSELARGYEVEKDRYVIVSDEEIKAIKIASSETIDLVRFVDRAKVDSIYFDSPYYIAPDGKIADETFRVLCEAMRRTERAGIGRLVLSNREHTILVSPRDQGMLVTTLRPADEIRSDNEVFANIGSSALDAEMVSLAERIIEQRSGPFRPEDFAEDRYQAALHELVKRKIRGEKPVAPQAGPKPSNVVNLMDALKQSLADSGAKPPAPSLRRGKKAEGKTNRRRKHAG